jgi:hypothetical protein
MEQRVLHQLVYAHVHLPTQEHIVELSLAAQLEDNLLV